MVCRARTEHVGMQPEGHDRGAWAGWWIIQLGVLLMTFGVGGFFGFSVGRAPAFAQEPARSPFAALTEQHANNAEYYAKRSIVGISRVQQRKDCTR